MSGMERESMSNGTVERGGNTIKWCYQTCPHEKQIEDSNMGYRYTRSFKNEGLGEEGGGGEEEVKIFITVKTLQVNFM